MPRLIWYSITAIAVWGALFSLFFTPHWWMVLFSLGWLVTSLIIVNTLLPSAIMLRATKATGISVPDDFMAFLDHPERAPRADRFWYYRASESYHSVAVPWITTALGLVFAYVMGLASAVASLLFSLDLSHVKPISALHTVIASRDSVLQMGQGFCPERQGHLPPRP
ncbi:hypothetical protein, partial [Sulfobacillus harzensis]